MSAHPVRGPVPGVAVNLPRRFTLPESARGTVPLEFCRWPIYSTVALAAGALPRFVEAFGYTVGQVVAGAGGGAIAATRWHTNMLVPRQLAAPKTFVIDHLRVHVVPLSFATGSPALADAFSGAAPVNDDMADDAQLIAGSMAAVLTIGEKEYAGAPISMIPGNAGLGGPVATAIDNTNATNAFLRRTCFHTSGRIYSFAGSRRPVLVPGQTFSVQLQCLWDTLPTINDDKYLKIEMGGILGREIQ